MLDNPKILITGATGFVGRNLIPVITQQYPEVYALVRESSKIEFLQQHGVRIRYADLLNRFSLRRSIKDADIIIHLASLMSDKDYLPREEFYRVNVTGTNNILHECHNYTKQFIYISTVGVYGKTGILGADESTSYGDALSDYEYSKAEAEKLIINFAKEHKLPFTILRLGQLYGPYMHYGWPEIIKRIESNNMFILGKGKKLLQLTYIDDVVDGVMQTIANQKCINQIFNICAKDSHSLEDIFNSIARLLQKPSPRKVPYLPIHLLALLMEKFPKLKQLDSLRYLSLHRLGFFRNNHIYDINKARQTFGYNPKVDLEEGMKKLLNWYSEHKQKGHVYG